METKINNRVKKSENKTRAFINKNFFIRYKETDMKRNALIGAGRYHLLVGERLRDKHFEKVISSDLENYTFKIRGRIIINFISK